MLVIIGMPRSGSISLHQYLINAGEEIKRDECIFKEDAVQHFEERWGDATPVIIFREPIARCWSWYHYMKPDMSYYRFLKLDQSNIGFGELNPIKQCNIKKYVVPFLKLKPRFYSFEHMILDPNFPVMNESNAPPMYPPHYDLTKEMLREELCKA